MKATELQISDIILVDNTPRTISQITKHKIGYHRTEYPLGKCQMSYARLGEVNPVPLTPEILKKNGFDSDTFLTVEWEREVYFKEFPGCVVESDDSGKYIFGTISYWNKRDVDGSPTDWGTMYESRIYNLHYVHELQHALRLCGLNELADNFKV